MNGMTCKQCNADAMETEEPEKRGGNEWQTKQTSKRNKPKNQSSIGTNTNMKTSSLNSIMRTGSNYSNGGRREGRSVTNQRQVRTNAKPVEHKINTTCPKQLPGVVKTRGSPFIHSQGFPRSNGSERKKYATDYPSNHQNN